MPAVVKRTVGSFSGTSDEFLIWEWFFDLKNSIYFSISSFLSIVIFGELGF